MTSCTDFDTSRVTPPRGTTGEEVYGVLCDRVGAQALRDDLTGASFRGLCHKDGKGSYTDKVDQSLLPKITGPAQDHNGKTVSQDDQQATRDHGVARVEALAARRDDLIGALDATFPNVQVPIVDIKNSDPTKTCNSPATNDTDSLPNQIADMIARFAPLYDDGTIPQSTESLARLVNAFADPNHPEYRAAWARFDSRKGYRPIDVTLGAARPLASYPKLRDFSNASLSVLSADSIPYDPAPKLDANGKRIPVPGPAYPQFSKLLETSHFELRDALPDKPLALLTVTPDTENGRQILSRPRNNLEMFQSVLFVTDASFGSGDPRFIVRRDPRGYAQLANGKLVTPFVDKNGDGLPDVDDLGQFVTADGSIPPAPFDYVGATKVLRDQYGRAVAGGTNLLYDYVDTSHTFAAQVLSDTKALVNPDPMAQHETMMDALAGMYVLFGSRDGMDSTMKSYGSDVLQYNQFHADDSPLLDLVYALMQVLGDPSSDDTLAMSKALLTNNAQETSRVVGAMLTAKGVADKHPEAAIPKTSVFWDENLDAMAEIAQEPGLLEDILAALADPASEDLGTLYSKYANYKDLIDYDPSNLNGPPRNLTTGDTSELKTPVDRKAKITGDNRSAMQRFIGLIADTTGVTTCNKQGAIIHAQGVPLAGSLDIPTSALLIINPSSYKPGGYDECEAFKIDNMAAFYLDAIVGKAQLYFRPSILRDGIDIIGLHVGAATVDTIEQSSGLGENSNDTYGFYDQTTSQTFRPRPQWLNRLVMFDQQNDSVNAKTQKFLADLNGTYIGTSVCPERVIPDPDPTAADAAADGMIHGLRNCQDGDWLQQRGHGTLLTWEDFGFYKAMYPLLHAFTSHNREDLFLKVANATAKHWQNADASASECKFIGGTTCVKDGLNSYEPLISEMLPSDILPGLANLMRAISKITVPHCQQFDPQTKLCSPGQTVNMSGIQVLAQATRASLDPKYAASVSLKDRHGKVTGLRNDGTTNPQVTPAYLITEALNEIDDAFTAYATAHPDDKDRQTQWKRARSQLVDQFLSVDGTTTSAQFHNPTIAKLSPTLLDNLRAQIFAHCPDTFTQNQSVCSWARTDVVNNMSTTVKGPLFASMMDLTDAVRQNEGARRELEAMLAYLLDAASKNEALPAALASVNDIVQLLNDDANITPFYNFMAEGVDISRPSADGKTQVKSLVDAQMALLAKASGKAIDANGNELCNKELDPNQVLSQALGNLVTPMGPDGKTGSTPLEIIVDVIADVNRAAPADAANGVKLNGDDYTSIAANMNDFLVDPEHGLEQFYEVIRKGTGAD
jgi:hypothetical protein